MTIDNKFNLGDIVFLKTDLKQAPRTVVQIGVTGLGFTYLLCQGSADPTRHYPFEITAERNDLLKMENH